MADQFLHREINFCAGGSISVLADKFLYWRINFCTGGGFVVPAPLGTSGGGHYKRPLGPWGGRLCTGGSVSVLADQFLYWKENSCTTGIISVLEREFLYCGDNFCTGKRILVLRG